MAMSRYVATLGVIAYVSAFAAAPDQIHLSWSRDPATTFTAVWHTASPSNPVRLEYRKKGGTEWLSVTGTSVKSAGSGYFHRASAHTLEPNTVYEYRVSSDSGGTPATSAVFETKTAPLPNTVDIRCAFIADCGLIGRLDGNSDGVEQIIDEIKADAPLCVLGGGDYAYANADTRYGSTNGAIDRWFIEWQDIIARYPFMPQYGNHEIDLVETFADWSPRFVLPSNGYRDQKDYSFDLGDAHFTAVFMPNPAAATSGRLDWLDNDLAAARRRGARWLIVYMHEPVYACGESHPASADVRTLIPPVLEKNKVDLCISAHDQSFERTYPLTNGAARPPTVMSRHMTTYEQGDGVVYAKISPSGKKSERHNDFSRFTKPQQDYMAVRSDNEHHYGIVTVYAAGKLELVTWGVKPDRAAPKFVVDSFVIYAAHPVETACKNSAAPVFGTQEAHGMNESFTADVLKQLSFVRMTTIRGRTIAGGSIDHSRNGVAGTVTSMKQKVSRGVYVVYGIERTKKIRLLKGIHVY